MQDTSFDYDIVVLTEKQYMNPTVSDPYIDNVLLEDRLVEEALRKKGMRVIKMNWDNPEFDWTKVHRILIRSIWDYHHRIEAFNQWLTHVESHCLLINSKEILHWNIDKHYLRDLENKGIRIVPTQYIDGDYTLTLQALVDKNGWHDIVLKPTISAAARNTYKIKNDAIAAHESIFQKRMGEESMIIQPFIKNIETKGELSMMVFGGKYSHTVLKKAKPGDFRVQDDFGGSVHPYDASRHEIEFAEKAVQACPTLPLYARVDIVWDDQDQLCLSELELIEPELWFRERPEAADDLAQIIYDSLAL